jgi:hypothetical protein
MNFITGFKFSWCWNQLEMPAPQVSNRSAAVIARWQAAPRLLANFRAPAFELETLHMYASALLDARCFVTSKCASL